MSTDNGWIKKMWYIYTMGCHSAMKRNQIGLFVVMWMNLESVIQSEVTQKEKTNIVHWCVYIESRKMELMNIFSGQEYRRRYWGHVDTGWGQLEGQDWHIYTIMCKTDTCGSTASHRELSSVLREDQGGTWEERGAQEGGHICTHIAGYCYLTAGSNTALQRNYTPV